MFIFNLFRKNVSSVVARSWAVYLIRFLRILIVIIALIRSSQLIVIGQSFSLLQDGTGEKLFRISDVNDDGLLNQEEFVAFLQKLDGKKSHEDFPLFDLHANGDPDGEFSIPKEFRDDVEHAEHDSFSFWSAFVRSFLMIVVTEIGDKTFFIAAILAMRASKKSLSSANNGSGTVFSGAFGALATMTILSTLIGFALPALIPHKYTHYISSCLFFYFGVRQLHEGRQMFLKGEGLDDFGEYHEAEQELCLQDEVDEESEGGKDEGNNNNGVEQEKLDRLKKRRVGKSNKDKLDKSVSPADTGANSKQKSVTNIFQNSTFELFIQAFSLTFLAEWGDRSQIATIALASHKDPFGVTSGGVLGHACCTGLAVICGKRLAEHVRERNLILAGGALFLAFAIHSFVLGPGVR